MCALRYLPALALVGTLLPCTAMAEQFTLVCCVVPAANGNAPEY
jgi:hypothetical protein